MPNIKKYNMFILISTISRNITEVFSSVLLYKMGYSLRNIFLFYTILYLVGMVTSIITINLIKKIKPKYLLIISSIIFGISFYYITNMTNTITNLIIFSILFGIGSYIYHTIRHYFALTLINNKKDIGNILIYINIAMIISTILGSFIDKIPKVLLSIIIIIISIISIIPLFKLNINKEDNKIIIPKIDKNKKIFFIFEQGKVINISLESLYLFMFIENKISYVGIFNIVLGISSIIFIYYFVRRINDKKYFKYLNILFCLFLILKINIKSKYLILFIGFFEGLGIKVFDTVSSFNIYNIKDNTNKLGYILLVEIIFCLTRSILCLLGYVINNIKIILYITIILVFITSFIYSKIEKY